MRVRVLLMLLCVHVCVTSFTSADQRKVSNELPRVTRKELIIRTSSDASCEDGSSTDWLCLHHGQPSACIVYRLRGFL